MSVVDVQISAACASRKVCNISLSFISTVCCSCFLCCDHSLGSGRTAKSLSVGFDHVCAVLDNNAILCWGDGRSGQLGYDQVLTSVGVKEVDIYYIHMNID